MKKQLHGILIIGCLLLFASCAKVIQTHQQAIQSYHNKNEVIKAFGTPDDKKIGVGLEEWTYDYDPQPEGGRIKQDSVQADTLIANMPVPYVNYVKFIFDTNGNVIGYKSHGVDFTKKKQSAGLKILKAVGITVAVILLIGVSYYSNSDVTL